jgi:hypothetical protein
MVILTSLLSTAQHTLTTMNLSAGYAWEPVATLGSDPGPRFEPSVAMVPGTRSLVTIGGHADGIPPQSDAYVLDLDSGAWSDLHPAGVGPPQITNGPAAVFDSTRSRAFFLGVSPNQIWELRLDSLQVWSHLTPATVFPPGFDPSLPMIWDEGNAQVLADVQASGEVVVWGMTPDPVPAWAQLAPINAGPDPKAGASAIYDPIRRRMLVFGGVPLNGPAYTDLWALWLDSGPMWERLSVSGPSPRQYSRLGYDPVGDRLVVFGGTSVFPSPTSFNDVWTFSLGSNGGWTQLAENGSVPDFNGASSFVYDHPRSRFVFAGGFSLNAWSLALDSTATWTMLQPSGTPSNSTPGLGVYDPNHNRFLFPLSYAYGGGGLALQWGATAAPDLACPPSGAWSPGSIRDVSFALTDRAGLQLDYEYTLKCSRNWPGFPIRGLATVDNSSTTYVPIGIPVPDTAAFGSVRFNLSVAARDLAGLTDTCSFTLDGEPAPIVALGATAQPDRAVIRWRSDRPGLTVTVNRRAEDGPWTALDRRFVSAAGLISYEDRGIQADQRYYYQLVVSDPLSAGSYGQVRLDIPAWSLGFAADQRNPVTGRFTVQCSAVAPGPVRLEAFDLSGRQVFDATQAATGPSRVTFDLESGSRKPPGVYYLRLSQGRETRQRKIVLLR